MGSWEELKLSYQSLDFILHHEAKEVSRCLFVKQVILGQEIFSLFLQ